MVNDLATLTAANTNFLFFIPVQLLALALLIYGAAKDREMMVARAKAIILSIVTAEAVVYAVLFPTIWELFWELF